MLREDNEYIIIIWAKQVCKNASYEVTNLGTFNEDVQSNCLWPRQTIKFDALFRRRSAFKQLKTNQKLKLRQILQSVYPTCVCAHDDAQFNSYLCDSPGQFLHPKCTTIGSCSSSCNSVSLITFLFLLGNV